MADQEPFKPDPNGEQDLADNQVVPPVELHEEVNRPTEEPAQNNQTNKLAEQMSRSERGMLRATRVMASFTVVLVIVTIFQAYSFVESERAYLTISDISFIENPPTSKPGGLDILIVLKNSGKHVAQILSVSAVPTFGFPNPAFRESPDYKIPNPSLVTSPIVPDGQARIVAFAEQPPNAPISTDDLIKGLLDGSITMWLYGIVKYDTGYPWWRPGELGYCVRFRTESERRNGALRQFVACAGDQRKYTYTR